MTKKTEQKGREAGAEAKGRGMEALISPTPMSMGAKERDLRPQAVAGEVMSLIMDCLAKNGAGFETGNAEREGAARMLRMLKSAIKSEIEYREQN